MSELSFDAKKGNPSTNGSAPAGNLLLASSAGCS